LLGLAAKIAFFADADQLGIGEAFRIIEAAVFDHCPEDSRQLVGDGGHRRLGPGLGFQPPEPVAQCVATGAAIGRPVQRLGGHAKSSGKPVVDLAGVRRVG